MPHRRSTRPFACGLRAPIHAIPASSQWGNKEKLPEHALLNLIGAFATLDLHPSRVGHDVLGAAYE